MNSITPDPGPLPPLSGMLRLIETGIAERQHLGAQVYVSLRGRVAADLALGEAQPGVALEPSSLMMWLSACKPVAAVAVGQLWEQGLLDVDDPVARHVPEFANNGKERITLRHVLTHMGGFRAAAANWSGRPWEEIIATICASRPEPRWPLGWKAGYDAAAGWFMLGEVVRRVSGVPFCRYARERIFEPLGMADSWIGIPPDRIAQYGSRIAPMFDTRGSHPTAQTFAGNQPEQISACLPGANGRGPARELGRFYEMLLGRGTLDGVRLLAPPTVDALTSRHRAGMFDHSFQHEVDWGLGFLINSAHYGAGTVPYGYGPHARPRAFGHSGNQSSVAFADPEIGLVAVVLLNGMPGEARHQARMRALLAALYEDLGLVPGEGAVAAARRSREAAPA
ncbi:MAG: beta-lactamase family protein [Candidatus Sumerlaeaceae bacterium]|nr:beta-lactamase family protein [Candidatus Sumerlaeaceae bacterium]